MREFTFIVGFLAVIGFVVVITMAVTGQIQIPHH